MADRYSRLSKDDAAVLLINHQTGLISALVCDQTPGQFKDNVQALADVAKYFMLPDPHTRSQPGLSGAAALGPRP
jgi:hypothetical protein